MYLKLPYKNCVIISWYLSETCESPVKNVLLKKYGNIGLKHCNLVRVHLLVQSRLQILVHLYISLKMHL